MRILWNGDVTQQIIRRMSDASQGMGDCLMDAKTAADALVEANEGGESKKLNRLTAQFAALTERLQAAQQELDDLVTDVRRTDQRFKDVEKQISAMIEGMGNGAEVPQPSGAWFVIELDGALSRGTEVVVSVYSETGEEEAFLQSAQFVCEGGGMLELKELDEPTAEPKTDSALDEEMPQVRVCTADGREVLLVPGDELVQTLYVNGNVLTVSGAFESTGKQSAGDFSGRWPWQCADGRAHAGRSSGHLA